jgi:glycerol kinase
VQRSSGRALSPVLSWQDRRNATWLERLAPHTAEVRALTGLPLSAHYGASKMRWCLDHLPAVQAAARAGDLLMAPLSTFVLMQLGAAPVVDAANASRTLLWDSARRDWSPTLLQWFGIEPEWLPRCVDTHGDFGARAGVGIPVTAVTGDQSAVPYAFGDADEHTLYVNLGTGAFVQRPLAERPAQPAPLLGSVLRVQGGAALYSLEGTVNGAGSAIAWFTDTHQQDESALWRSLESADAPLQPPLFVNAIGGLGSPWWRPYAQSRWLGDGTLLERFAAVVESIAFLVAINVECMTVGQSPPRRLLLTGGISRSDWLCRRLAALLQLPVSRSAAEATARGAAALAAPQLAQHWPQPDTQTFAPAPVSGLPERAQAFRAALDRLI